MGGNVQENLHKAQVYLKFTVTDKKVVGMKLILLMVVVIMLVHVLHCVNLTQIDQGVHIILITRNVKCIPQTLLRTIVGSRLLHGNVGPLNVWIILMITITYIPIMKR